MTRIDFYVLADMDFVARQRFACRLAQKAAVAGQGVHLHTESADATADLDELLWGYPADRFIPHERLDGVSQTRPRAPISVGHETPLDCDGVLINLASTVPEFFASFDRVAEIIVDANKTDGRSHYKHYRDRGYPLHHHDIDEWES